MKDNTGARTSAVSLFSEIARESHHKLLKLGTQQSAIKKKLTNSRIEDAQFALMSLENEINRCAAMVIVFSAIALEAYIYDYASRNLTDKFVESYLDKLDPVSKWVVIPRLATGKELPKDHRWFELIKRLIQQRNTIIHHKSSSPPSALEDGVEYYKNMRQREAKFLLAAEEAIELLDLLLDEIKELDVEEYVWAHGYLAAKSDNPFIPLEEL